MRRFGVLVVVLVALVVAGCGSSASSGSSGSPTNTELSYFPSGSPFVMSIQTDPNSAAIKQLQALVNRFPIASLGLSALRAKLDQSGLDYQGDIRPLFGNPAMLGLASATAGGGASKDFLIVWVTKDAGKLAALIKKLPGVHAAGSHSGATLYREGDTGELAVDGPTVVFGATASILTRALDRHASGGGMTPGHFAQQFAGLPLDSVIQIFGSVTGVLAQPRVGRARQVPWVRAFKGYAITVGASPTGLAFNFHLDTTGAPLTADQVPFASGNATPSFAGSQPITVAIKDPAQIVSFIESAAREAGVAGYARFTRSQARLHAKTGTDVNSLVKLLTGDLIISGDTHMTMGRAAVRNAGSAARILAKLATQPKLAFDTTTAVSRLGGGFYAVKTTKQTVNVGLVGNELVVGKAAVSALRSFAAAPTTPATGARGTVAFRVGLAQLLHLASSSASSSEILQTIVSSLGDVTGWVSASPSGITGNASLAIH